MRRVAVLRPDRVERLEDYQGERPLEDVVLMCLRVFFLNFLRPQ